MDGGGYLKGDSNHVQNLYATLNNYLTLNKSGFTIIGGFNFNNATSVFNKLVSYGVILGVTKSFLKNTLLLSNNNTFLWNKLDGNSNGNTVSADLNLNYTAFKKHQLPKEPQDVTVSCLRMKRQHPSTALW